MHPAKITAQIRTLLRWIGWLFFAMGLLPAAQAEILTNLVQLRQAASGNAAVAHRILIQGELWWSDFPSGTCVVWDGSTAEVVELASTDGLVPPRKVVLGGTGTVARYGAAIRLGTVGAVVDNDGIHGVVEKAGAVYLTAGRQPLRVEWFNAREQGTLEIDYEGPSLPRRRLPRGALFRTPSPRNAFTDPLSGLNYSCYEGSWESLPDFAALVPLRSGTVPDLNSDVRSRDENVALLFSGYLNILQDGLYRFFLRSDDGSRLAVGSPTIKISPVGQARLPAPRHIAIGQAMEPGAGEGWATVEGRVTLVQERAQHTVLEVRAGAGRMRVEIADNTRLPAGSLLNARIRATGFCQATTTFDGQSVAGILYTQDRSLIEILSPTATETITSLPTPRLLTTAAEVHRLKRAEAQQGLSVRLRGVVTSVQPEHQAFVLQDTTRGIYIIDSSVSRPVPPRVGELLDVEGATDPSLFAPIVVARRVTSLGAGQLPEAVHPTWDQLLNGSLDAQYVELQGIITSAGSNTVTLLTRDGVIRAEVRAHGLQPGGLARYENSLVRLRGCLFATWDYITHQVRLGEIRLHDADLFEDRAAPSDLFACPAKTAAELLLFDPLAGAFQPVRITGQIVHANPPEYFMQDETRGVRLIAKNLPDLKPGDRVEVVGFPDLLAQSSPVLREAVVRKFGSAPLPNPRWLEPDQLLQPENDSTRVRMQGRLIGLRQTGVGKEQFLEMQSGVKTFVARRQPVGGPTPSSPPVGSRLELIGTYATLDRSHASGPSPASFELLLDSASGIQILERPPWWTLERLMAALGGLLIILAATALWVWQLRRLVGERTVELGSQIQERQRVESQRAMEQERARIAHDLHDELGSGITEIGMLAERAKSQATPDTRRSRYLEQMAERARELVTALDEIVWAMNPRHDSLASLVSYFSLYADRFLGLANIAWHLEQPPGTPDIAIDSPRRHQLFLTFREALNNVVRHSGATEVQLRFRLENESWSLLITDNGRGLPPGNPTEQMEGVASMRQRIEKLGGRFDVASAPGQGTLLQFSIPLSSPTP